MDLESVRELERNFRLDPLQNANCLSQLIALCKADSEEGEEQTFHVIKSLQRCWITAFGDRLYVSSIVSASARSLLLSQDQQSDPAVVGFVQWVQNQYSSFFRALNELGAHEEQSLSVAAIQAASAVFNAEGRAKQSVGEADVPFKSNWWSSLLASVLTRSLLHPKLVDAIDQCFLQYADGRYYTLKALEYLMKAHLKQKDVPEEVQHAFSTSVYSILERVEVLDDPNVFQQTIMFSAAPHKQKKRKVAEPLSVKKHTSAFSRAWMAFLRLRATKAVYKMVLVRLNTYIIPHLKHPRYLVDFLTRAYNTGGVVAVLSLESLFSLMTQYGLEIPNFFPKLYAMLSADLFYVKYRQRFFELLGLIMRSSHLPEYLAAAFIKKLARMALRGPPYGAIFSIQLIFNIMTSNPTTLRMIHAEDRRGAAAAEGAQKTAWKRAAPVDRRGDKDEEGNLPPVPPVQVQVKRRRVSEAAEEAAHLRVDRAVSLEDPFLEAEEDPAKCRASESQLWEILGLQQHYNRDVARLAGVFSKNLLRARYDTRHAAAGTGQSILARALKRKGQVEYPLEYRRLEDAHVVDVNKLFTLV